MKKVLIIGALGLAAVMLYQHSNKPADAAAGTGAGTSGSPSYENKVVNTLEGGWFFVKDGKRYSVRGTPAFEDLLARTNQTEAQMLIRGIADADLQFLPWSGYYDVGWNFGAQA